MQNLPPTKMIFQEYFQNIWSLQGLLITVDNTEAIFAVSIDSLSSFYLSSICCVHPRLSCLTSLTSLEVFTFHLRTNPQECLMTVSGCDSVFVQLCILWSYQSNQSQEKLPCLTWPRQTISTRQTEDCGRSKKGWRTWASNFIPKDLLRTGGFNSFWSQPSTY